MATRTIEGTLDTQSVDAGSEITYLGSTAANNPGEAVRGFRVNPGSTGDIKVTIDRSNSINTVEIFQEDAYTGGSAPNGYKKFTNIARDVCEDKARNRQYIEHNFSSIKAIA